MNPNTQGQPSKVAGLRQAKGLTQSQLAKIVGITPSKLASIEQGRRRPDRETVRRLAGEFDTTAEDLFGYGEVKEGPFAIQATDSAMCRSRKRRKLTLESLSRLTRLSTSALNNYELGHDYPSADVQAVIARALGEPALRLFGEKPVNANDFVVQPTDSKLTAARKRAGLSPSELAQSLGIKRATLLDYESGRAFPNIRSLQRLCRMLRLPPVRLFDLPGTKLARARVANLLEQRQVAKAMGISLKVYRGYESGRVPVPIPIAQKASAFFKVPIDVVLDPGQLTEDYSERPANDDFTPKPGDSRLTLIRKSCSLTRGQLAAKVGVTERAIRRYETGENFPPLETLRALCRVLKHDATELFDVQDSLLKRARLNKLVSPEQVAAAISVPVTTYYNYETGTYRIPYETAQRLSRYFDMAIPTLVETGRLIDPPPNFTILPTDKRLTRARKSAGLSSRELADRAGTTWRIVEGYEKSGNLNHTANAQTFAIVGRISVVLEKPPAELFIISGTPLAQARVNRLMTQAAVARALGVPPDTYKNYEAGSSRVPRDIAEAVSELLNVKLESLFRPSQLAAPRTEGITCARCQEPLVLSGHITTCTNCGYPVMLTRRKLR